jgi:hypothetical protein
MQSKWITGEQIMNEHGEAAADLGQACHNGIFNAYLANSPYQIHDISKVDRIPQYPPIGIDSREYVQRGENVQWDWDKITGRGERHIELLKTDRVLGFVWVVWESKGTRSLLSRVEPLPPCDLNFPRQCVARYDDNSPRLFQSKSLFDPLIKQLKEYSFAQLEQIRKELLEKRRCLYVEASLGMYVSPYTRLQAELLMNENGDYGPEIYSKSEKFAWEILMPTRCLWLIDGETITDKDAEGRLFHFDFAMFRRFAEKIYNNPPLASIINTYKDYLGAMWFKRIEVDAWLGTSATPETVPETVPPVGQGTDQADVERITVNIPSSLWAGKTAKTIFNVLRERYADEIIAYILVKKIGTPKTDAGRFFYPDDGEEREAKTYRDKINSLLEKVDQLYTFSCDG